MVTRRRMRSVKQIRARINRLEKVRKHSKKYPHTVALSEHGYGTLNALRWAMGEDDTTPY